MPTIESLTSTVDALKPTLSESNIEVVERRMSDMNQLWTRLEEDKDEREKGANTSILLSTANHNACIIAHDLLVGIVRSVECKLAHDIGR